MAKTFEQFLAALPPEELTAIAQETGRLIAEEMTLQQPRKARERSQEVVGEILHINQAAAIPAK